MWFDILHNHCVRSHLEDKRRPMIRNLFTEIWNLLWKRELRVNESSLLYKAQRIQYYIRHLTLGTARAGAIGKSIGCVAASAKATTLARGVTLCFCAAVSVINTQAAAPSFKVLALAAVIVPTYRYDNIFSHGDFICKYLGLRDSKRGMQQRTQ